MSDRSDIRTASSIASASAKIADDPLQMADCVGVIETVRDSVRVLENGKHAS